MKFKKIFYVLLPFLLMALSVDANAALFMGAAPDLSSLESAAGELDVSTVFDVMKTVFGFLIGVKVFKMGGNVILSVLSGRG